MKKNDSVCGYGILTNVIKMKRVYMIVHKEGEGTEENPIGEVRTFFDENAEFLGRIDAVKRRGIMG